MRCWSVLSSFRSVFYQPRTHSTKPIPFTRSQQTTSYFFTRTNTTKQPRITLSNFITTPHSQSSFLSLCCDLTDLSVSIELTFICILSSERSLNDGKYSFWKRNDWFLSQQIKKWRKFNDDRLYI